MASPGSYSGSGAANSTTRSSLRRSRRQQNAAPEFADDVMEDVSATASPSQLDENDDDVLNDAEQGSETAEYTDALEHAELIIDLDDDEELDDDDDEYEEGEEFDELEDDDEDDDDAEEDEGDHVVLNLNAEQAQRLIALTRQDTGDDEVGDHIEIFGPGQTATGQPRARMMVSQGDILRFFRQAGFRQILSDDYDDDEQDGLEGDEEHARGYGSLRARRTRAQISDAFPKVPSDEGRALMESGEFGTNEGDGGGVRFDQRKKLAARIMRRELGLDSPGAQRCATRLTAQSLIPQSKADTIIHYDNRCYSGQFSDDGNFFFSCAQDFRVRMYDTSNPYDWKYYKTVAYPYGQWTITDASLSPDNKYLAYSSIRSLVCLAATDPNEDSEPFLLDFADHGRNQSRAFSHGTFGIWSIRFSGDGRELVAGTSDNSVYAYDIETRQSILRIHGHYDDVNAVCFGDKMSPHLLYSGSDDTTIKVWDRRSMSDNREAGVFLGHTEGITYVDSKGDGRYVLSNGKDQTMKLWDLRKMMSSDEAEKIDVLDYSTGFDYRFQTYNEARYKRHPHDSSVVTFRGHKVLKTLIRCHFSPPGSTDSRYVYSGSEDGAVYIYNLDATLAGKVDVTEATRNSRPQTSDDDDDPPIMGVWDDRRNNRGWKTCVRDASWHPYAPVIAATSWNGHGMQQGTCTTHTWNDGVDEDEGDPPMGQRVDQALRPSRGFYEDDLPPVPRTRRTVGLRGGRRAGYDV